MDRDKNRSELIRLRKLARLTQGEMAKAMGMSRSNYANFESNERYVVKESILARARHITGAGGVFQLEPSTTGSIRVYGSIKADDGEVSYSEMDELLSVPIQFVRPNCSGVVVHGDSAHPYLQPGDIAIFADNPHPKVGKFIAARPLDGGDPIVKVVAVDAHRYLLRSANPAYNDLPIEQFQILGVLIGIYTADGELAIGPVPSDIGPDYLKDRLSNRLE